MGKISFHVMAGGISIIRLAFPSLFKYLVNPVTYSVVEFQKFAQPTKIERWAVVNFSARCDTRGLVRDLIRCGDMKGIVSCLLYFISLTKKKNLIYFIATILNKQLIEIPFWFIGNRSAF